MLKIKIFMILIILFNSISGFCHFAAKFEPSDGRVFHGAEGELPSSESVYFDWDGLGVYSQTSGATPVLLVHYITFTETIPGKTANVYETYKASIEDIAAKNSKYIPQIGLDFFLYTGESAADTIDISQNIAEGEYDDKIRELARMFKGFQRPVFFRPGFELGGNAGQVYSEEYFKYAFRRIVDIFREEEANNVAFVWCVYKLTNYIPYYPGSEYVDWCGIDIFESNLPYVQTEILNLVLLHNKPMMICESAPRYVGVDDGQTDWDDWFDPFFSRIPIYPNIKGFCYINASWAGWVNWQDSRIQNNSTISSNYNNEMSDSKYIHLDDIDDWESLFGPAVGIKADEEINSMVNGTSVTITWTTVNCLSGTDGLSTSQVEYGYTSSYGFESLLDETFSFNHSVNLINLEPDTEYHYRVKCRGSNGIETTSGDYIFITGSAFSPTPTLTPTLLDTPASTSTFEPTLVFTSTPSQTPTFTPTDDPYTSPTPTKTNSIEGMLWKIY